MLCLPHFKGLYIFGCTVFQTRLIYKVIVQYYISEAFLPVSVSIKGVQWQIISLLSYIYKSFFLLQ